MNPSTVLRALLPPEVVARFEARCAVDPACHVARFVLGDRVLEWWASIAPLVDAESAALLPPLPPEPLRRVVSDFQAPLFLWTGVADAENFLGVLHRHSSKGFGREAVRVLDFGGGCGRVSRHLAHVPGFAVTLADANRAHVRWCRQELATVRALDVEFQPPLDVPDDAFDATLAISVFTHLGDATFDRWLKELRRVTAPGGLMAATVHGATAVGSISRDPTLQHYFRMPGERAQALLRELDAVGFRFAPYDQDQLEAAAVGAEYGSTFVSKAEAARRAALAGWTVLEHREGGLRGWQDLLVLRRDG
ncbi:MAG TPA: class I SAM-dependent methyltransferase [Planctomycetota bacterium]|nr:class I SAM-dependent methyltransferase [Planctomycetota bacterium]